MYNHAPENYICPICVGLSGAENDQTLIRATDIVYSDDLATVLIGSFFVGNNPGHPIIVPNKHFENFYDLPENYAHRIMDLSKKVALALKQSRDCDGITIMQNNEPAGNQHAFHYHQHVFPRFKDDELHQNIHLSKTPTAEERKPYADALKEQLNNL